ncbi:hypothetical protein EFS62_04970, partial [Lactobacillus delbrueckii]|uniref:hypothetical protein n=1 Tax=Lactobacillus delbrueckii TaxID=1584 RepID=UPI0021A74669
YIAIISSLIEYLLAKLLSFQGFIVLFGVGSLSHYNSSGNCLATQKTSAFIDRKQAFLMLTAARRGILYLLSWSNSAKLCWEEIQCANQCWPASLPLNSP